MVQSVDTSSSGSNILTAQEMHQRVMMQKLNSYDKDSKAGLSKMELNKYVMDSEFGGGEAPEFAQQLVAKFDQLDQDKDGQLSGAEVGALQNNRGLWSVAPVQSSTAGAPAAAGNSASVGENLKTALAATGNPTSPTDLLTKNIQSLVKRGLNYAKSNPQLMTQLENTVHKII